MTPTELLKHEHKIVLMVLEGAEKEARSIGEHGVINELNLERMVDFFRNFTDKCHHAKEEKHLFILMQERGVPKEGGPIGVMLHEHEQGRARVKAVAEAIPKAKSGDANAREALKDNLAAYVELLQGHIDKENNVLFPMADRILTPEDQKTLTDAFDRIEAAEMGEGTHEKYHHLAHEMAGH